MGLASEVMATYTGTSATYAAATTGATYTPKANGRLRKLILIGCATAATSLIEGYGFRLKNSKWPYDVVIESTGGGLRTAPAFPIPAQEIEVDLPVTENSNITIEARHFVGTVVTPVIHLLGVFEY